MAEAFGKFMLIFSRALHLTLKCASNPLGSKEVGFKFGYFRGYFIRKFRTKRTEMKFLEKNWFKKKNAFVLRLNVLAQSRFSGLVLRVKSCMTHDLKQATFKKLLSVL